jgi:hypothetical protein
LLLCASAGSSGRGREGRPDRGTQLFPDFPQIEALSPLYKINDGAVVAFIVHGEVNEAGVAGIELDYDLIGIPFHNGGARRA